MGFFDFFTSGKADKREEALMSEKTSRAIAIAVGYTAPEELDESDRDSFGKATFKLKLEDGWQRFDVLLHEDVGEIIPGDQWIVKLDEEFTRIITPQLKLGKSSQYRIFDDEQ